mgnify:FL=1
MKINYLFSGVDKEKGFDEVQSKYLKQDIKENQIITFIASTFDNHEQNIMYKNKTLNFFSKINITFKENYLIDNNVTKEEAKEFIKKSNIIYLMGGDTYLQNNSLDEYELKPLIKEKSFIIGVSAGSLNQTKRVVYQDYNDIKDYEGLGFTNISIYPHLDFLNIDYLKELFKISKITKLVALPNSSFIRIEDNKEMFVGDYYEIENEKINLVKKDYEKINHLGSVTLETERLLLRKTIKEDIDELFYIELNPNVRRYLGTHKVGTSLNDNRNYFDFSKYDNLDFYRWSIVEKDTNKLLGCIYLNVHDEKARIYGIDYFLREDSWNKGYATEASKCILNFAFEKLNVNRIESSGAKSNPGTLKVMEHIGLKYEGVRKDGIFYYYGGIQDLVLYGITKEEYYKFKK